MVATAPQEVIVPVTAKLSREFYEKFGDKVADELVNWFNRVDATYRSDLKDLNELNFARLDAKLEQRAVQLDAKIDQRAAELDARTDQRAAQLDAKIERVESLEAKRGRQKPTVYRFVLSTRESAIRGTTPPGSPK